jgi:polyhydroxybutyrate depolymerase
MNLVNRDLEKELIFGDWVRRYHIHLPSSFEGSSAFPLLIALHGRLGTGKKMIRQTDFNRIADREGFIVVYPEGFKRGWADGRGISHADKRSVDDVAFIDRLVKTLQENFPIDPARITIAGHSNGGFMAQRLAIEIPHDFAAVAVVAASVSEWLASRFTPGGTMPILFINGTADPVTPYLGGRQPGGARVLSVEDTVKMWVRFNGCKEAPEVLEIHESNNEPLVSVSTYGSCKKHSHVKLYTIKGGGHVWPGEPEDISRSGAAKTGQGVDASEEIWKFFESISKVEKEKCAR